MSDTSSWVPTDVDVNLPNAARIYDYWLGGSHNFGPDRTLAEQVLTIMPGIRDAVRLNRAFLARAARFMVQSGIRQFLDVGSGIPTVGNLHEIVQRMDPECRVVYVDRDSIAVSHSELMLGHNKNAAVVQADLRDRDGILNADAARPLLDLSQPVGLFMLLLLHFVPDEWDPAGIVAGYRDALASGSYIAISHVAADSGTPGLTEAIEAYKSTQTLPTPRTREQLLPFFAGFDLVEPGLVGCAEWRPAGTGDVSDSPEINALPYAGVARKP
ncbi:SAM-dependent methyltransferase [Actinocrispum wychmicini]|uniref:S-adenosyl methyltransferase n=1 Tax=Actinocrispum wychmicini TaxID=1213861 RepID=A0A4V2S7G2_9PSEU|nr:SAM-dependent methyltransferase [Actinocrispum wychmicini]TCO59770.1 S-adenosyl methyltransferase [Actinocrispum wychmicini]